MNALEKTSFEDTPFALKWLGKFDQALLEYAHYYGQAAELGDPFMEEQCFEQMFDLVLLDLYRKQLKARQETEAPLYVAGVQKATTEDNLFKSRQELRQAVTFRLRQLLEQNQSFKHETFDKALAKCWQKFNPRGRGKNPFSVDSEWLVAAGTKVRKADLS